MTTSGGSLFLIAVGAILIVVTDRTRPRLWLGEHPADVPPVRDPDLC
jgi:hypothetical protein